MYKDQRGWLYKVKSGIGEPKQWKVFYWKPRKDGNLSVGWHGSSLFKWGPTRMEAEQELLAVANERGWVLV